MSNMLSSKISVFPSTRRGTQDPKSRLVSESSFANIVNKLIETKGFVITPDPTSGSWGDSDNNSFEFNIYGYYFNISDLSYLFSLFDNQSSNIYAYIELATNGNYVELAGQDSMPNNSSELEYTGVKFVSENPNKEHELLLFTKSNDIWIVPPESRIRFDFGDIDGGVI